MTDMSNLLAKINEDAEGRFFTMVVREQSNGFGGREEVVVAHYKARFFATRKAAEKSTSAYIAKD